MFKTKKYQVIRGALSKELANFIFNYMMLQRDAVDWMVKNNKVNAYNPFAGTRADRQVPGVYSKYGDWIMETLLMYMIPIMKTKTGMDWFQRIRTPDSMKKEIFSDGTRIDRAVKFLQPSI